MVDVRRPVVDRQEDGSRQAEEPAGRDDLGDVRRRRIPDDRAERGPFLGRLPWVLADGIRDPAGSWQGGGRPSYRVVFGLSDNAARGRLGAKTAAVDPREMPLPPCPC